MNTRRSLLQLGASLALPTAWAQDDPTGGDPLGAMTWPTLLVRGMLAEQIYRAHSILSGHPYHRA